MGDISTWPAPNTGRPDRRTTVTLRLDDLEAMQETVGLVGSLLKALVEDRFGGRLAEGRQHNWALLLGAVLDDWLDVYRDSDQPDIQTRYEHVKLIRAALTVDTDEARADIVRCVARLTTVFDTLREWRGRR